MANQRYYPYVPWDDDPIQGDSIYHDPIHGDTINHDMITADYLPREGIYGPLDMIFKWLSARDNKMLIADTRVIGTLQTA